MAVRMVLPPGFRFHPTDEELVSFYLKRKAAGLELHSNIIAEVDLYRHDPWELPSFSCISSKESEAWYFFHSSDKKYPKGHRTNRATLSGYWKATGRDRPISDSHSKALLAVKKTLVFYKGRAPSGERTDWVMHEYQIVQQQAMADASSSPPLVVCRIVKKKSKAAMKHSQVSETLTENPTSLSSSSSSSSSSHFSSEQMNLPTISLYAHMEEVQECLHTSSSREDAMPKHGYDLHLERRDDNAEAANDDGDDDDVGDEGITEEEKED